MGGVHSAVFLVEIAYLKFRLLCLPDFDKLRRVVGRTVINDEPDKILERLTAQALIALVNRVGSVVCRCEHRQCFLLRFHVIILR